jgi:exonuclease SbcC
MRPQKLTLKNFMPFRSTDGRVYEVDFSTLDLFAITGPTGSGKSSLIDAIVWCLYGRTARYGADSKGVISAGENSCEVFLDFTVGSRRFRAVRRTGRTTESGLSEREGDEWVQDVSGAEQLTKRVEALLGLDFASFTKTVILPQGEYAQFLASKPGDRRELLAKILELGVYARVAERAKEVSGRARARADTIRETLHQYAGVGREQVAHKRQEREDVEKQLQEAGAREEVLRGVKEIVDRVSAARARIAELQEEERRHAGEQEQLRRRHDEAEAQLRAVAAARSRVAAERDALRYDPRQHEVLQRAAAHLRTYLAACQEADRKGRLLADLQAELEELARQIAEQERRIAAARGLSQERAAALQANLALHGDIAALTEKIAQAQRWKELHSEQARLEKERDVCAQHLAEKRQAVARLRQQEAEADQAMRELLRQRDQVRAEEQEKRRLELEAAHLEAELREAADQEKRVREGAADALARLQAAEQAIRQCQEAVSLAEQQERAAAQALEERRRLAEAAHLRQTLHVGAPCPVCQVPVRELPRPSHEETDDLSPARQAVEEARVLLNRVRAELQEAGAAAAAARARKESAERELAERERKRHEAQERFVGRFPDFASPSAALGAVRAERQTLTEVLRQLEARVQVSENEKLTFTQQREQAQQEEATAAEAVRGVTVRLAENEAHRAALRQTLAPYLAAGDDPEALLAAHRRALVRAQEELKTLEQQQQRAEEHLRALGTQRIQKEGDRRVLASQREASVAQAERDARSVRDALGLTAEAPLPQLTALEGDLADLARRQEELARLAQREDALCRGREEAERQVAELRTNLRACERVLAETRKKSVAVAQELERARAVLRAATARHGLGDLGPDGEGVKGQLAALQEHVISLRERRGQLDIALAELERRCGEKEQEEEKLRAAETEQQLATDLTKLLGADFMDFLSRGAVEILMRDASAHLRRLTHGRYAFDIAYKGRAIELQIVDHEDHKRKRPTHSLSGGETFLASLAIALALAQGFREVATGKAARTSTECLILDEGFGTLDREGLQLVTETLQELRGEEGRMVGIITHVEEIAAAMPMRIEVRKGSRASTIAVTG